MSTPIVIGFDGGGTNTRALLVGADGSILGSGRAGASNLNSVGFEGACTQLLAAAEAAWADAGLPPRPSDAGFLGMAGLQKEGDGLPFEKFIEGKGLVLPGRCRSGNDTESALSGGLPGEPGIVLIAGTGSFAFGRDFRGSRACCGGWGWLLDDVGGGVHLGRECLQAVIRAADGRRPATALSAAVLSHAGLTDISGLIGWVYNALPYTKTLAGLAPLVMKAAREEDRIALEILRTSAEGLAEMVEQTASKLQWVSAPKVVLVGGVALSGAPYQDFITRGIRTRLPGAQVLAPLLPPVAGSAIEAFSSIQISATPGLVERLRSECARRSLH